MKIKLILSIFMLTVYGFSSEVLVSSLTELQTAINAAEAGDEIILANGNYTMSSSIDIDNISGESDSWITIRAESVGGAVISGTRSFKMERSNHVKISGFYFTQQVESKCFSIKASENIRVTNCTFDMVEDGSKSYWLYISGTPCPKNIRIDHNDFEEKYDEGCFIVVYGPDNDIAKYVTIDHNHFKGHFFGGSNGGEAIRYGDSNRQNYSSYAVIEENLFEHCDGDPEVISVKSTNLTVRRNTLQDCNGSIVLRHGDSCLVESNYILNGDGGIRFYGDNQKIIGNYIYNNDNIKPSGSSSSVRGAICVGGGKQADLANGENTYDQPSDCIVAYNTLVYNRGENIDIGVQGNDAYPPKNLTIANNIVLSDEEDCSNIRMDPETVTYANNIFYGNAGAGDFPADAYSWIDPEISESDDGLFRISSTSPAINNSYVLSELSEYTEDIDGQTRSNYDIGADEYSSEPVLFQPLTEDEVGPQRDEIYCTTTEEIHEALTTAVPGDRIVIAPGTYYSDGSTSGTSKAYFYGYADGTAKASIYVGSEDPDNPAILEGDNLDHRYVLYIIGDYWTIDGLELKTGQKGLILDNANHTQVKNVTVHNTGTEGIHIRDGSSDCLIDHCNVYNTGRINPGIGEGIYVGSAINHWDDFEKNHTGIVISNCTIGPGVTAEHLDIKEATIGTIVENCTFNGTGISGEHYADSFMDVKGNYSIIRNNIGYRNDNSEIVDAFQTHEKADVWGFNNYFYNNELYLDHGSVNIVDAGSGSALVSENIHHPGGTLYSGHVTEYDNLPPIVRLIGPENGDFFIEGEHIYLSAEALDVDGDISEINFLANDEVVGTATTEPYQFTWSSATAGTIILSVEAIDSEGGSRISDAITITVDTPLEEEELLTVAEENITASDNDGNLPKNTIDGDYNTRWSAEGSGQWIQYDLGKYYFVSFLKIAFYKGNERQAYFDIQVSDDGAEWTDVLTDQESSGTTAALQIFNFENVTARYVRFIGYGNSENDWNSITEFQIWGMDPLFVTDLAPIDDTFIRGGTYSSDNYALQPEIVTSRGATEEDMQKILMKFNMADIEGTIQKATLKLFPTTGQLNEDTNLELFEVEKNNWFEFSLTWDNAPAFGNVISVHEEDIQTEQAIIFDVLDYLVTNRDKNNISFGLALSGEGTQRDSLIIASIQNSNDNLHPVLTVESELIETGIEDDISANLSQPEDFQLFQNYPNPFNPRTTIQFTIPEKSPIKIRIFNIQGQLVETLYNSEVLPGIVTVDWNAQDYSSGVYFCQMIAKDYQHTIKMMLLK